MSNVVSRKSFGDILMKSNVTLTISKEVCIALQLEDKGEIFEMIVEDGRIVLEPKSLIPEGEEWYWTEEWQTGEREASEDIKAGRISSFNSLENLLKDLNSDED